MSSTKHVFSTDDEYSRFCYLWEKYCSLLTGDKERMEKAREKRKEFINEQKMVQTARHK